MGRFKQGRAIAFILYGKKKNQVHVLGLSQSLVLTCPLRAFNQVFGIYIHGHAKSRYQDVGRTAKGVPTQKKMNQKNKLAVGRGRYTAGLVRKRDGWG
jgi:hypothetical protein